MVPQLACWSIGSFLHEHFSCHSLHADPSAAFCTNISPATVCMLIHRQLSARTFLLFTTAFMTRIIRALRPFHFLDIFVAFMSWRRRLLQALNLLSAHNTLHSPHISSNYAKKLFRILHPSNLTIITLRCHITIVIVAIACYKIFRFRRATECSVSIRLKFLRKWIILRRPTKKMGTRGWEAMD